MSRSRWVVGIAASVALFLSGCAEPADPGATESNSSESAPAEPGDSGSDPAPSEGPVDLPGDFPEEIPLPQGATLTEAVALGDLGWQLFFDIGEQDSEAYMNAYAADLENSGFEARAAGGGISATSDTLDIGVTIDAPELFLQVTKQQ